MILSWVQEAGLLFGVVAVATGVAALVLRWWFRDPR